MGLARHLRGPETPDSDLYIFWDVLKYLVCIRADARSLNININPGISIIAGTPRQHPRGPEPPGISITAGTPRQHPRGSEPR